MNTDGTGSVAQDDGAAVGASSAAGDPVIRGSHQKVYVW